VIANSLFAATGLTLALIFFLGNELRFLIPYRLLLLHQYGTAILLSVAVLFVNLTGAAPKTNDKYILTNDKE